MSQYNWIMKIVSDHKSGSTRICTKQWMKIIFKDGETFFVSPVLSIYTSRLFATCICQGGRHRQSVATACRSMSHVSYESVKSRMDESCLIYTWRDSFTCGGQSVATACRRMSHVSYVSYGWIISHDMNEPSVVWISHVAYDDESEWPPIWMSNVLHEWDNCRQLSSLALALWVYLLHVVSSLQPTFFSVNLKHRSSMKVKVGSRAAQSRAHKWQATTFIIDWIWEVSSKCDHLRTMIPEMNARSCLCISCGRICIHTRNMNTYIIIIAAGWCVFCCHISPTCCHSHVNMTTYTHTHDSNRTEDLSLFRSWYTFRLTIGS